jgi:hypothetical protein
MYGYRNFKSLHTCQHSIFSRMPELHCILLHITCRYKKNINGLKRTKVKIPSCSKVSDCTRIRNCVLLSFVISGVCAMSFATLDEARCSYGTDEDAILIYSKSWTSGNQ